MVSSNMIIYNFVDQIPKTATKKPPIPTLGIRGGMDRGSTLIYHF